MKNRKERRKIHTQKLQSTEERQQNKDRWRKISDVGEPVDEWGKL